MEIDIKIGEQNYKCDLSKQIDISIPFVSDSGVIAFGADPYNAKPFQAGDFIGSIESGAPVNFYNIFINPHGNGTHTETVRHIDSRGASIFNTLKKAHFVARLITIEPTQLSNCDWVIQKENFEFIKDRLENIDALIIRTLPNSNEKLTRNYTGTNPCYIDSEFMTLLNETSVKHLLFDMPSVDRELDEGRLSSHKTFWKTEADIALEKTITELIYVDNDVVDGLYLLNMQTISLDIDACPSKPLLYALY